MTVQIPLAIGLRDDASFDNFYAGGNDELLAGLRRAVSGRDSEGAILLWGGSAAGKTHLLQAACRAAHEQELAAAYIPLSEKGELSPDVLEGLEQLNLVCLDDLQAVAGDEAWETALFHLYNRLFDNGAQLIMAADANVAQLGIDLPDLRSRLSWGFVFHLHNLDDQAKLAALQLRARQRGVEMSDEVGQYLIRRQARDMRSLFNLLDELDAASLAAQRRLTVPFVRQWLSEQGGERQTSLF